LKLIILFIAAIQDQRTIFLKLLRQMKPLKVAIFQYRAVLLFLACRCYDSRVAAAAAAADRRINTLTRVVAIFSTTYGKRIGRKRADASAAKRTSDIVMIHAVGKV